MAARAGIAVVGVDKKNPSNWGAQYWRRPLKDVQPTATVHQAAAVVLGRGALGLSARRRAEVTAPHQRMDARRAKRGARRGGLSPRLDAQLGTRRLGPRQRRTGRGTLRKTGTGNGSAGRIQTAQDRRERSVG